MAAKTPIRTVYTNNVATGLAEFQSGEFVDYGLGGTGLTALGSAGQVLKVNSGASALEYGAVEAILNIDGMTDGSGITIVDADKFAISDGGTEKYITASQLSTYITSEVGVNIDGFPDGTSITVAGTDRLLLSDSGTEKMINVSQIDTFVSGSTATLTNKTLTSPVLNTGVSGTAVADEDNMSSNSATKLATQQSIKAYADAISGGEITAFTDAWKNYNDVDTTAEITIPTTKNYFLCGPISVTGSAVWTISGLLRII